VKSTLVTFDGQCIFSLVEFRDSSYLIGLAYIICWCLLQLLLQQPINSMPILLLLVQILSSMLYFSCSGLQHIEVEVCSYIISSYNYQLDSPACKNQLTITKIYHIV
jgi:ethanolaminephosphotransferase